MALTSRIAIAALLLACGEPSTATTCADVGTHARACWGADGVERVERWTRPPSARGWREDVERADVSSAFACDGDHCVQRHVALPDEHVWECRDEAGALVCLELARAAGTTPGALVPGFRCGARSSGARVCIDTSPDRPDERRWRCDIVHEHGERMRCERATDAELLVGDACGACPPGASCIDGLCLPNRAVPECWDEHDCDGARCALGECQR